MLSKSKKAAKTTQIGFRLEEATRRRLERRAKKARRGLSDYVRLLIEQDLERAS